MFKHHRYPRIVILHEYSHSLKSLLSNAFSPKIQVSVSPLFSDTYVAALQAGRRNFFIILMAYVARIFMVISNNKSDLVLIEKELLPWLPAWVERILLFKMGCYILDYDDAVFHSYDKHSSAIIRWSLGNKHAVLIRGAKMVLAGNQYRATYALEPGAKRVEIFPT